MKRLYLDFVQGRPWRLPGAARERQLLFGVAALTVLGAATIAWQWLQIERQIDETGDAIAVLRRELLLRSPPRSAPLQLSAQQIVATNDIIAQWNTPWPALLDGFESVATTDIALLQIEPDHRRRVVRGLAEAKNHQRMLVYLARLGSVRPFTGALVNKQEINDRDANRPLRFLFEAQLVDRPDSPVSADGQGRGDE